MSRDPEHLADLELAILRELAEEAHLAVLQIGERPVRRARAPEAVEVGERVGGEVDRRDRARDAGVRELRDLLREQRAGRVRVPLVPAPALDALEPVRHRSEEHTSELQSNLNLV